MATTYIGFTTWLGEGIDGGDSNYTIPNAYVLSSPEGFGPWPTGWSFQPDYENLTGALMVPDVPEPGTYSLSLFTAPNDPDNYSCHVTTFPLVFSTDEPPVIIGGGDPGCSGPPLVMS